MGVLSITVTDLVYTNSPQDVSITATEEVEIEGQGAGTLPLTGEGVATVQIRATAAGALVFVGSGTGTVSIAAEGAGVLPLSGSGVLKIGQFPITGEGSGVLPLTGSGSGTVSIRAAGQGVLELTGTGTGAITIAAEGYGVLPLTGEGQIEVADVEVTYNLEITELPEPAGSILDLQYRVDGAEWQSFGAATIGTYQVNVVVGSNVQIRAVNSGGASAASDTKIAS